MKYHSIHISKILISLRESFALLQTPIHKSPYPGSAKRISMITTTLLDFQRGSIVSNAKVDNGNDQVVGTSRNDERKGKEQGLPDEAIAWQKLDFECQR